MKHMSLKEIAVACGGVYYGSEEAYHQEVTGVAIDSRKVEPGFLFVAVRGARVDGHVFIPQVMEKGALCAISEKRIEGASYPYILVNSSLQALKDLAEHYRKSLNIKVVGITGSVGKTSTKEMIASVLSQKYKVLKTEGNFNNEIGLPLTVFNIREEHQIAVLEMGISHFGDMEPLAKIARPDICVISNIGLAHIEALKSRDGILKEKTDMFRFITPNGTIILNGDDDKLSTVTQYKQIKPIFFGLNDQLEVYADHIQRLGLKGTACQVHLEGRTLDLTIPIPGPHMVYNALAGVCVGAALGLSDKEICQGVANLVPISGRNNLIEKHGLTILDDCYNANPVSMKASLEVLTCANTRKVAILGDMFELGEEERSLHREVGEFAAQKGIDLIISIGELSKAIHEGAISVPDFKGTALHFDSKDAFFAEMSNIIKENDTILVKASHGMEFPEIIERL